MSKSKKLRILVTGAGGFIGSHATEEFVKAGHKVTALCHYNSLQSNGWLDFAYSNQPTNLEIVMSDVTDSESVHKLVGQSDVVVHFAALIAIPYSYIAPRSYLNANITGTFNVLEAIRHHQNRLVNISTSEVYGTPEFLPISEQSKIKPQSPYAASKVAADALCNSYIDSFGSDISIIRPFNTYGPRQSQRAIIPTILSQALSGQSKIELGNIDARRDFTYVADTVSAVKIAVESEGLKGKTIHLGTGRTISIQDLISLVNSTLNLSLEARIDNLRVRPSSSEVEVLQSDPSLAKELLGWKATTSLEEGLQKTFEWLGANRNRLSEGNRYII